MYGTVARMQLKPGSAEKMKDYMGSYERVNIPGFVNTFVYQTDSDPNVLYMAVVFDSKESYTANAGDPAQDKRFREMMELLSAEPEWHDGEIIYQMK